MQNTIENETIETYPPTFKEWFEVNLLESANHIVQYGANCGYAGITTNYEIHILYEKYEYQLWDMANESASDMGYDNALLLLGKHNDISCQTEFEIYLVWFVVEILASFYD